MVAQQRIECAEKMAGHLRAGEIEHELMALRAACATGLVQAPVRVGAVEFAIRVHHLRLHPKTEVHAEPPHGVDQRRKPIREETGVGLPVAEAACVVAPTAEPAVVEHEAFDAERGSVLREALQRREVLPEADGLPSIEVHAARTCGCLRQDASADMAVQRMAQRGAAAVAHAQHRLGRIERAIGRHADLAGIEPRRHQQTGAIGIAFDEDLMIAAPSEMGAERQSMGLGGVGLCEQQPMTCAVSRPPLEGHRPLEAVGDRAAHGLHLGGPAACVAGDGLRPSRQRQRERGQSQHRDLCPAVVFETRTAGDDAVRVQRPLDRDRQGEPLVEEAQLPMARVRRLIGRDQHELGMQRATVALQQHGGPTAETGTRLR